MFFLDNYISLSGAFLRTVNGANVCLAYLYPISVSESGDSLTLLTYD